jgi:hypothetical protein
MVNARIVNVSTGKITKAVSEDIKGEIEDLVSYLPSIARQLVAPAAQVAAPAVLQRKSSVSRPVEPPAQKVQTSINCKYPLYVSRFRYDKELLGFSPTDDDWEEVHELLLEAINECFDNIAALATENEIGGLSGCSPVVVRCKLNSYTIQSARMGQFEGTADITLQFYLKVTDPRPAFTTSIRSMGARHWGESQPFINAFEEIANEIEDRLVRHDFIKKLSKQLHEAYESRND